MKYGQKLKLGDANVANFQLATIHNFVRAQLVVGATMTLAFLRFHYPRVDLFAFGKGVCLLRRMTDLG
jgi:hypothetical protein